MTIYPQCRLSIMSSKWYIHENPVSNKVKMRNIPVEITIRNSSFILGVVHKWCAINMEFFKPFLLLVTKFVQFKVPKNCKPSKFRRYKWMTLLHESFLYSRLYHKTFYAITLTLCSYVTICLSEKKVLHFK